MEFKVKKPARRKKKLTDAMRKHRNANNLKWITNKYKTGDLDLDKPSHRIMARIAVSKGLIPEEALNDGEE